MIFWDLRYVEQQLLIRVALNILKDIHISIRLQWIKKTTLLSSSTSSESSMLYFVCFVCFIRKVHSHRHSTDNSPVAPPQGKASGPGSRLCAAVTLSLSFRWSHGLNTNLPSPSRLSFRHCSFSMSMRWYSPYSRPLSAGSCSPAQPQPCPCPWPCPCPDIVEVAGRKTSPPVLGQKTVGPDHDTSKSETVLCVQWLPCGVAVENDTSYLDIFKIKRSYTNDERGFLSKIGGGGTVLLTFSQIILRRTQSKPIS